MTSSVRQQHLEHPEGDIDLGVPGANDVVVVLVPALAGAPWRLPVQRYLARAREVGADVIPVALCLGRQPPSPLDDLALFEVPRILQSYHFGPSQFREAGAVFARIALSRLWPTYSRERLKLFLSHRQEDGAIVAARLRSAISDLNQTSVLDVADIRPGTRVSARIVEELDDSDVFVLCDTPKAAGDHAWLKDELCLALGMALPIVWVRFGQVGQRSKLLFRPSDEPDLDVDWPHDETDYHEVAAPIIDRAFIAGRNQVRRVETCLKQIFANATVDVLDDRWRLLMLQRQGSFGPFQVEQRIVLQAYARRPTKNDEEKFRDLLISHRLLSPDGHWPSYGLALMVGPAPGCNRGVSGAGPSVAKTEGVGYMHAGAVATEVRRSYAARQSIARPEMLLFATVGSGQGARQEFRDAVQDVATVWIARGGRIRFGGHPTVTPTVHWVGRSLVPGREKQHVTIYQSKYFVTPQLLSEISQIADVRGTEVQGAGDASRQLSLTHMREEMINMSAAVAAIVIGGLTRADRDGQPGVEEEMLLARARGIPVFLFGATGGQAALMAAEARAHVPSFANLGNSLSVEDNEFVTTTDDYTTATEMVWNAAIGDS